MLWEPSRTIYAANASPACQTYRYTPLRQSLMALLFSFWCFRSLWLLFSMGISPSNLSVPLVAIHHGHLSHKPCQPVGGGYYTASPSVRQSPANLSVVVVVQPWHLQIPANQLTCSSCSGPLVCTSLASPPWRDLLHQWDVASPLSCPDVTHHLHCFAHAMLMRCWLC